MLDLTLPFQELQRNLIPLTRTLPITILNIEPITLTFFNFYSGLKDGQDHLHSGLDSALSLHQALYETCLGETLPYLTQTVRHLLRLGALRALDPKLIEKSYSTLSLILRVIAPNLLKSEDILRSTWHEMSRHIFPKGNKRYVRKCVTDAWSGVMRKARAESLARLVDVMLEDEEIEGMEAIWANALKGSVGKLHSRSLPIFDILLDRLVIGPDGQLLETITKVVINLVHHCTSASMVPIIEAIMTRLNGPSPSASSSTHSTQPGDTALLQVLSTVLLIRKGKRFPKSLLKPMMLKLVAFAPSLRDHNDEHWRRSLVSFVVGCLQAGKLATWLSPGVSLIDGIWEGLVSLRSYGELKGVSGVKNASRS